MALFTAHSLTNVNLKKRRQNSTKWLVVLILMSPSPQDFPEASTETFIGSKGQGKKAHKAIQRLRTSHVKQAISSRILSKAGVSSTAAGTIFFYPNRSHDG